MCTGTNRQPCSLCSRAVGPYGRFLELRALFLIVVAVGIAAFVVIVMATLYEGVFGSSDAPLIPNAVLSMIIAIFAALSSLTVLKKGRDLWRHLARDPGLSSLTGRKYDDLTPEERSSTSAIGLANLLLVLTACGGISYTIWESSRSRRGAPDTGSNGAYARPNLPEARPSASREQAEPVPSPTGDAGDAQSDGVGSAGRLSVSALPDGTLFDVRSPDGQRAAQLMLRDGRYHFAVDGKLSPAYEGVGLDPPVFSPNSRHLAYVIHRGGRLAVVLDGNEADSYLDIAAANAHSRQGGTMYVGSANPRPEAAPRAGLVFSPDSKRLAYAAWLAENRMAVIVDGRPGPIFEAISIDGIYFSPDSLHIAYVAGRAGAWHVVVDDQESAGYSAIGQEGLDFSSDWQRVTFRAREGGAWRTVSWSR